ncbi:MAG TPA: peptidylprolyl isomerase, partial [Candidatus Binataceae bacterium]
GVGAGFFSQVKPVASVDGQKILADEVQRQADMMRRSFQNMYGPQAAEVLKHMNLQEQALEQIVNQRLGQREARHLGLGVSDEDLRNAIAAQRAFQVDGRFDVQTYEALLSENNMTPPQYEELTRTELTMKLLRDMVSQAVVLSDAQARQAYDQRNERVAVAYIEIPSTDFISEIHPTPQQVEKFYQENGEMFREPERVKVDYILYDPIKLGEKVNPSDKEIADFYQRNLKTLFSYPARVRARHILIAATPEAPQKTRQQAQAKAQQILDQLKKGADFAKLAAQDSDDPGTRDRGGDLGFFERGQMIKPFEDTAFNLKPGQLSGVVATRFGFHIIRVEEVKAAHIDTLVQSRPRIVELIRERSGKKAAIEAQRADLTAALSGARLGDLANKRGLQVVSTPMFASSEPIPKVGINPDFSGTAFKLGKGEVATVNGKGSGLFLVQLIDREPAHIPPLKQIADKVRDEMVRREAESKGRERAENLIKQIKTAADFNKVAEINHLTVHKTEPFDRSGNTVPTIGDFPEVAQGVGIVTPVPGVMPKVMVQSGNYYIVELLSRQAPGIQEWNKAAAGFKAELLQTMREQAWDNFIAGLKRKAAISVDASALGGASTESSM